MGADTATVMVQCFTTSSSCPKEWPTTHYRFGRTKPSVLALPFNGWCMARCRVLPELD